MTDQLNYRGINLDLDIYAALSLAGSGFRHTVIGLPCGGELARLLGLR